METIPCPHCAAPIKPTATFCLACDTPVTDTERGLSVAETSTVVVGRPLVGLVIMAACLVTLVGATAGVVAFVRHQHARTTTDATTNVSRGMTDLVAAEAGQNDACKRAERVLAAPAATVLNQCRKMFDHDTGAHLDRIAVDRLQFDGSAGTARVLATITDGSGTHRVDDVVNLLDQTTAGAHGAQPSRHWRMSWDGLPVI